MNTLIKHFDPLLNIDTKLYTPPTSIFKTEHNQIEQLISSFVKECLDSSIDWIHHLGATKKPFRPIWITPESTLFKDGNPWNELKDLDYYPIILISASRAIAEGTDRKVLI